MKDPKLFSIGEMSKIHQVSIKTLRYYDSIGLLTPAYVSDENGYRYYSHLQFEALNTIRFMKYLGIPLEEIKEYLENRNKEAYLDVLKKEKEIIADKLAVLNMMASDIDRQIEEVQSTYQSGTVGVIEVRDCPAAELACIDADIYNIYDLEMAIHELKNKYLHSIPLVVGLVGVIISKDLLLQGSYDHFTTVGIYMDAALLRQQKVDESAIRILPEGRHVCMTYHGNDHTGSPECYRQLMNFIAEHKYTITGDALERVIINEYKTDNPKEYLTEIRIPVNTVL